MKNKEIYSSALSLLDQRGDDGINEDYEERAPYLIAAFCSTVRSLDKKMRKIEGLGTQNAFSPVHLSLDQYFPLCDRFIPAAALYVASMLVIDEDAELADSLYDKYCDNVASIAAECESIASAGSGSSSDGSEQLSICESIVDRYYFD